MMPPKDICRRIYETDQWARLAWAGRPSLPGEYNPGKFVLVKLFHKVDAEKSIQERWLPDHGPVYAKDGSTKADWDKNKYVPMW